MSNAIAELFVNLGITGTDNVAKGLKSVDSGMGDVASSGLAAKAAILAVVYGLEQMMSSSAQAGTNIQNLTALTGVSGKFFQQMGNAAKLAGASSQDATQMVVGLYKGMGKLMANEGIPAAYNVLHLRYTKDAQNMAQQLIAVAQANKDAKNPLVNKLLNDIGMTDQMQELAMRGKFDPKKLDSMLTYSDAQTAALDRTNEAMNRLQLGWSQFFGGLTAEHGAEIVGDISSISHAIMRLGKAMDDLGKSTGTFKDIGSVAHATAAMLNFFGVGIGAAAGKGATKEQLAALSGGPHMNVDKSGVPIGWQADFGKKIMEWMINVGNFDAIDLRGGFHQRSSLPEGAVPQIVIEQLTVSSDHDPQAVAQAVTHALGEKIIQAKSKIPLQGKAGGG